MHITSWLKFVELNSCVAFRRFADQLQKATMSHQFLCFADRASQYIYLSN